MENIQSLFRVRPSMSGKINAPSFAYKCVYGKLPSRPLRGMYGSPQQRYQDMYVDKALDPKILDKLNNISEIEIRSVCAGHNPDNVTHIMFRPYKQDVDHVEKVSRLLNVSTTKSIFDIGNGGMYRVCVATKNWYRDNGDNNNWKQWWEAIPSRIKKAVT